MIDKICNNNESQKEPVIYVKPVLTYDQIVEIIDERIARIEEAAQQVKENTHLHTYESSENPENRKSPDLLLSGNPDSKKLEVKS